MSDGAIRAFIAVDIEDSIRSSITEVQSDLKKTDAKVSWVPPENMHLTLVFLGDITAEAAAKLSESLDEAANKHRSFICDVDGVGFFGSPKAPRTLWVGVSDSSGILKALQHDVAEAVGVLGHSIEKRSFKPHLTIGRVRSSRKVDSLTSALRLAKNVGFGTTKIERLLLMQSHLAPRGAQYTILHESALKGVR